jgi:hypothetical protein
MPSKPSLWGKGSKGRPASPVSQQKSLMGPGDGKAPKGAYLAGLGTTTGGKPAGGEEASGVMDPATFNVDHHALRQFSNYATGKRAGPDWLHKRVEAAEQRRFEEGQKLRDKS